MKNENTYKLAWGRALVECLYTGKYISRNKEEIVVNLYDVSKCILKYYWNQTFFFNLRQSPNRLDNRMPYVLKITNDLIEKYKKSSGNVIPVWFNKVEETINPKILQKSIKSIVNVLPKDVSWRFKRVGNNVVDLYSYDEKNKSTEVIFKKEEAEVIKEYALIISKLLNYKWVQLLEHFNYAPKIANKVNSISESNLKRESLSKYKVELMRQFEDGVAVDFYSGMPLDDDDISVDHVIPWSFMYSDDIWNLVLTSKSFNSSKSNTIPSEEVIEKLKLRNKNIVGILSPKYSAEMMEAIEHDYIDRYYFECRL